MAPYLRVVQVSKNFGRFTALKDVSFSVGPGEFICLLGPSGCGKTTVLRVVAGLEQQDAGHVFIKGRDVSNLPVAKRNVGIVFQSYALFPNLSAAANVAYGLKGRGLPRGAIKARVGELLELVGLQGLENQHPGQLSGGQQQRVALARAMALSPDLLLLDEPLSALDAQVRVALRSEIRLLQKRLGVTTIMVTHDQEEALTMADRIMVMNSGRMVQSGAPTDVYDRPATPFVASFVGSMNFIENAVRSADGDFKIGQVSLDVANNRGITEAGSRVVMAIRPEDVEFRPDHADTPNTYRAHIHGLEYRGATYRVTMALPLGGGHESIIEADVPREKAGRLGLQPNLKVAVRFPRECLHVYMA
jgi:iron(III) transport system ATP-binding protein